MGYTHYWRRDKTIDPVKYKAIVEDFKKLVPIMERQGVKLAGGLGEGIPTLDNKEVWFNGQEHCGHKKFDLGIAWPATKAVGVANDGEPPVTGGWFAGAELSKRSCGGDCSHETFHFPQTLKPGAWNEPDQSGQYFDCCKTAFKPYDWAVTAFLVIAKHYLGDKLKVSSDGEMEHWSDAMQLCQIELGYGMDFRLPE